MEKSLPQFIFRVALFNDAIASAVNSEQEGSGFSSQSFAGEKGLFAHVFTGEWKFSAGDCAHAVSSRHGEEKRPGAQL